MISGGVVVLALNPIFPVDEFHFYALTDAAETPETPEAPATRRARVAAESVIAFFMLVSPLSCKIYIIKLF